MIIKIIESLQAWLETKAYCATLAHKTNHSFEPNSEWNNFFHPRWSSNMICSYDLITKPITLLHWTYQWDNWFHKRCVLMTRRKIIPFTGLPDSSSNQPRITSYQVMPRKKIYRLLHTKKGIYNFKVFLNQVWPPSLRAGHKAYFRGWGGEVKPFPALFFRDKILFRNHPKWRGTLSQPQIQL